MALFPVKPPKPKGPAFKIRIIYKSGYAMDAWFEEFTCTRGPDGVNEITARACEGYFKPLVYGISEIAAIYQIDVVK